MFWDRFYELCCSKNTRPNPVGQELGISSGILTKWKTGTSYPNGENLIKIAKHFNCSIDYLVGLTDKPNSYFNEISPEDAEIIRKIHSLSTENQEELIHMVNYKYEQFLKKRKESLSLSTESTPLDNTLHRLA